MQWKLNFKKDRECLEHSTENIKLNSNKNFPWKQTNSSLIVDKKTLVVLRILTENYEIVRPNETLTDSVFSLGRPVVGFPQFQNKWHTKMI